MTTKLLYIDTETTGLDPKKNDVIQIAGIVVIDGVNKEEFNIMCQPFDYATVAPEALAVHGNTIEKLKTFQKPEDAYREFVRVLSRYIDKFNKFDKFVPAGQNVKFDLDFLREFFLKNRDPYFGSWVRYQSLDLLSISVLMSLAGKVKVDNFKLGTIAESLGITFKAHDAMEDIRVTKQVMDKYIEMVGGIK